LIQAFKRAAIVQVPMAHDLYMIWHVKGSADSDYDCVAYDSVHSGYHCSGGTCCLGRWYTKDEGSMFLWDAGNHLPSGYILLWSRNSKSKSKIIVHSQWTVM